LRGTPFEGVDGVECIGCGEDDLPGATRRLVAYLTEQAYDLVMILPGTTIVWTICLEIYPRICRRPSGVSSAFP
jgi:hypothetical protein